MLEKDVFYTEIGVRHALPHIRILAWIQKKSFVTCHALHW